ncbi:MAG: class I SAM-dependent methyltransferase [Paenibacillaceae bacterium]|nr:class I SAM-dependent methyltransferase [Paenibacillaceae bacterium]
MAKPAPVKPAKALDSTKRFTSRVGNYVKYRPSYPQQAIDFLYDELGFASASAIADVGSGTGIFTSLLLDRGSRVYAVEPNEAMREAAERQFEDRPGFVSCIGTAEQTGLDDETVDRIVCAQSFHWFDQVKTKAEFARVLRPGGIVALVWNNWHSVLNPFTTDYEALLNNFGNDYQRVRHTNIQASDFERFFKDGVVRKITFGNSQHFDLEGVQGRLLSSSYIPEEGEPQYDAMIEELQRIYAKHADGNGQVAFDYVTDIYYGEL